MTSQLLPLTLSERTSHRQSNDAIWDLRHDLRHDSIESRWFSFVNATWLGPGPSLKWDSVRVQAKSWVKSQVKTVSEYGPRAPSQYPKRRLSVRSRKVSKPRDLYLKLSDRSEIWQALRQHCCRCACQISKRYDNLKYQSRGFEISRDLTKRRLFGYWDGAQDAYRQHFYRFACLFSKRYDIFHPHSCMCVCVCVCDRSLNICACQEFVIASRKYGRQTSSSPGQLSGLPFYAVPNCLNSRLKTSALPKGSVWFVRPEAAQVWCVHCCVDCL